MASIKYSCMSLLLLSSSTILAEQREANVRPLHLATLGGGESSSSKHRRGLIGREFCQTQGDCASCFGPGYILCPGAAITCYKPGDPNYGIDSCSPGSSSPSSSARSTYTPTATASVAGSSYTIPSFCSNGGRNCAQCFGAGYIQCSADSTHCYNPNDPDSVCPGGSSGGSAPSSGSSRPASSAPSSPSSPSAAGAPSGTSSLPSATGSTGGGSCAAEYGSSYVNCGTDSCYNPSTEVCCSDGSGLSHLSVLPIFTNVYPHQATATPAKPAHPLLVFAITPMATAPTPPRQPATLQRSAVVLRPQVRGLRAHQRPTQVARSLLGLPIPAAQALYLARVPSLLPMVTLSTRATPQPPLCPWYRCFSLARALFSLASHSWFPSRCNL